MSRKRKAAVSLKGTRGKRAKPDVAARVPDDDSNRGETGGRVHTDDELPLPEDLSSLTPKTANGLVNDLVVTKRIAKVHALLRAFIEHNRVDLVRCLLTGRDVGTIGSFARIPKCPSLEMLDALVSYYHYWRSLNLIMVGGGNCQLRNRPGVLFRQEFDRSFFGEMLARAEEVDFLVTNLDGFASDVASGYVSGALLSARQRSPRSWQEMAPVLGRLLHHGFVPTHTDLRELARLISATNVDAMPEEDVEYKAAKEALSSFCHVFFAKRMPTSCRERNMYLCILDTPPSALVDAQVAFGLSSMKDHLVLLQTLLNAASFHYILPRMIQVCRPYLTSTSIHKLLLCIGKHAPPRITYEHLKPLFDATTEFAFDSQEPIHDLWKKWLVGRLTTPETQLGLLLSTDCIGVVFAYL